MLNDYVRWEPGILSAVSSLHCASGDARSMRYVRNAWSGTLGMVRVRCSRTSVSPEPSNYHSTTCRVHSCVVEPLL